MDYGLGLLHVFAGHNVDLEGLSRGWSDLSQLNPRLWPSRSGIMVLILIHQIHYPSTIVG